MKKKTHVLIFPAGEINSVELHDALSHNVNIEVFGCSSEDRHGGFVFKNYKSGIPNIADKNFISVFNELIFKWKIDYIFPTHDSVALFLARNRNNINATVIVAPLQTAEACRDKKVTYNLFSDCSFCPQVFDSFSTFPVFIKPRSGQGSKGTRIIKGMEDIPNDFSISEYIICEYLPGEEMTVDCLTDNTGKLCVCAPRVRNRLLAGVCVAGSTIKSTKEILDIAKIINKRLKFFGLWYFQIKKSNNGVFKLLEISTRCAGTMCLTRARGLNLPLLSVYAAQGKGLTVFEHPFNIKVDRTLISRYVIDYEYDKVYIDYDDTIIENEKVCLPVIKFLYQCRNKGLHIILLTRHEEDHADSLEESLKKHALPFNLFDKVILLKFSQSKAEFINPVNSIFIDNSYAERKIVHDAFGIPVFDVEGMEVLEDWRC